jgi:large subunit ribosomal protein L37Ae
MICRGRNIALIFYILLSYIFGTMYSHTRKVGSLGRYGPRVGRKLRNQAVKIELERRYSSKCPSCSKGKVKRLASGIWQCRTCDHKFTGGAHISKLRSKSVEEQ